MRLAPRHKSSTADRGARHPPTRRTSPTRSHGRLGIAVDVRGRFRRGGLGQVVRLRRRRAQGPGGASVVGAHTSFLRPWFRHADLLGSKATATRRGPARQRQANHGSPAGGRERDGSVDRLTTLERPNRSRVLCRRGDRDGLSDAARRAGASCAVPSHRNTEDEGHRSAAHLLGAFDGKRPSQSANDNLMAGLSCAGTSRDPRSRARL